MTTYSLPSPPPQVEPNAGKWLPSAHQPGPLPPPDLRVPTIAEVKQVGDPLYMQFPFPAEGSAAMAADLQELRDLAMLRDQPSAMVSTVAGRKRLPISRFLLLRPQPLGAVYNKLRAQDQPTIQTGRELARWFEKETPGLAHAHALNLLFSLGSPAFSPPKQAQIWAVLHVSIYAALLAAWHYKWDEPATCLKPRPVEIDQQLSVLYDFTVLPDGTGDGNPVTVPTTNWPGTPRHPSYPSGHSVVGGAASEALSSFFPAWKTEFDNLADNHGLARMWAGIHYRADHEFGIALGRAVAQLVIKRM